ncbi:MAG: murein biosynthesis integral membrane protein MurJ [Magnetococcus sp. WYHC-3]
MSAAPHLPTIPDADRLGLVRAVGIISFFTMGSRVLGFVRDIVIARMLGAGLGADAFFVALKLPNFLRRLFAEGAFSSAFVPVFSDSLHAKEHQNEPQEVARTVFTVLLVVLMAVVAVAQLLMPLLISLIAPGFLDEPDKFNLTVDLTRITFFYILFISLTALAGGILNSLGRFAVPAATPMLLNLSLIVGALWISPHLERPTMGLALGVFIGGAAQLLLQWPALVQAGMVPGWRWNPKHPAVKRILLLMGPAILGVSVAQVNLLFDLFLASWLPEGSISYLYYADRLVEFPLGLIGIAMGTAILPALSAKASRGDVAGLEADLDFGLRLILFINLPATVALVLLREPLLTMLFERGAFSAVTTEQTARALLAYGSGLLAFSAVKVFAPAFYALKDTRTPVRIAIICMVSNMGLNLLLMFPLQHAGLALATSLASYLNFVLLVRAYRRKTGFRFRPGWGHSLRGAFLASALMGFFLWLGTLGWWSPGLETATQVMILLPLMAGGMFIYFGVAHLWGSQELAVFTTALGRRLRRKAAP